MLLCDHCEKAFHAPCCNPKTKMSPTDEWFCQSCSKLAGKVSLEASFMKSQSISCCNGIPEFKWGPIALMLKYPEPYTSRPRIGGCFQATVPEWSDQMSKDFDSIGEPLELDPAEIVGLHGCPADKYLGAISNWLQCQEVLYDGTGEYAEGTICYTAPLSEVQTHDWDCSCSVLLDPSNSDCAVPQELETSEVLFQLKYIEQLKSRLATKKIDFRG
ncbi:hypothetical protein P3X46_007938 [Hevea brasiliensis]|uniref:Zinc finger PHD-type domain-containing protein n=1 Tax=Hevea brasiliensis TaxID=3981 RepID=A0ABQ9MV38_HEVBR|nr:hypothetical protein P3X46_007938 [Hevea brasiliensis]